MQSNTVERGYGNRTLRRDLKKPFLNFIPVKWRRLWCGWWRQRWQTNSLLTLLRALWLHRKEKHAGIRILLLFSRVCLLGPGNTVHHTSASRAPPFHPLNTCHKNEKSLALFPNSPPTSLWVNASGSITARKQKNQTQGTAQSWGRISGA